MESKAKRFLGPIMLIAAALAAGAAGAAVVVRLAADMIAPAPAAVQPAAIQPVRRFDATKVTEAARSAVTFYKKRVGTGLDAVVLPSDRVGNGVVITADGWVLTAASVVQSPATLIAVFSDRSSVAVDLAKIVRDDATGLAFVGLKASHLIAASFGNDPSSRPGDPAFVPDYSGVLTTAVVDPRELPVENRSDYVESSEKLSRRLTLEDAAVAGSAVIDPAGEVIGIVANGREAVPASFVMNIFRDVFKNEAVARPRAGIRYLTTEGLPAGRSAGYLTAGALVTGAGKYVAVAKGSAAEAAGLKEGDVIISIEHDRVNGGDTFAEMIQDYVPGATVELGVVRNGKEIKITLTFK